MERGQRNTNLCESNVLVGFVKASCENFVPPFEWNLNLNPCCVRMLKKCGESWSECPSGDSPLFSEIKNKIKRDHVWFPTPCPKKRTLLGFPSSKFEYFAKIKTFFRVIEFNEICVAPSFLSSEKGGNSFMQIDMQTSSFARKRYVSTAAD